MSRPELRPMGFGEILDTAFSLYREHFGTFFLAALLPNVPVALFWIFFGTVAGAGASDRTSALAGVGGLVILPYSVVAGLLVWGALVHGSSRAFTGEAVSLGGAYRRVLQRFFPLLGAVAAALVCIWLGTLLLIVPGVLAGIMLFAVSHAVVIEGEGPLAALGRSREIAKGGWGRIFGIFFITWLIVALPSLALFGGAGFLAALNPGAAESAAAGGALNAAFQAASVVVTALTTPYMVASLVVLYYDRRVRGEGLDLELAAEQMSPAG